MKNPIPYPLRSAKLSFEIQPFGFWFVPRFTRRKGLTESAKQQGASQWWFRFAWFQLAYSR